MRAVEELPLELPGQIRLFDTEPEKRPEASQWFTPHWIALRLAAWIPRNAIVVEPSCGSGNLIAALIDLGHPPELIRGIELDRAWADFARERFNGRVEIFCMDFRDCATPCDAILMNPPFEDAMHARFIDHALKLAPLVVGIFPVAIEFGGDRARGLWMNTAQKTRRALLPDRVKYGGDTQGKFDSVALKIKRRTSPRAADDQNVLIEETWLPS